MFLRFWLVTMLIVSLPGALVAGGGEGHDPHFPHHHIGLFAGAATETQQQVEKQTEFATGLEYEARIAELWGVGAMTEFVGNDAIRETILFLQFSVHFYGEFRLVLAPGIEFAETKKHEVFRVGLGYEFALGHGFTLAPEFNADFIEGGKITYVYGLTVGAGL